MRISDWSSDVCSSDLRCGHRRGLDLVELGHHRRRVRVDDRLRRRGAARHEPTVAPGRGDARPVRTGGGRGGGTGPRTGRDARSGRPDVSAELVAAAMFAGVISYALFGGADYGAGVWALTAGRADPPARAR